MDDDQYWEVKALLLRVLSPKQFTFMVRTAGYAAAITSGSSRVCILLDIAPTQDNKTRLSRACKDLCETNS